MMARSLDARHTEDLGTSTLFNVFLLIAMGVMVLAMFSNAATAGDAVTPSAPGEFSLQ